MTLAASKASVRSQEQDWKLLKIKKITWSQRKASIDLVMFLYLIMSLNPSYYVVDKLTPKDSARLQPSSDHLS